MLIWNRTSLLRFLTGLLMAVFACNAALCQGQASNGDASLPLVYDVASIRPFEMSGNSFMKAVPRALVGGTLNATGVTLIDLLYLAYGVHSNEVNGTPSWAGSDLYTIIAKADPELQQQLRKMNDDDAKVAQQTMLQALLASRFQLQAALISKEGSVFALSLGKNEPKLSPSAVVEADDATGKFSVRVQGETLLFHQCSMPQLTSLLSRLTQREIVDQTGLTGKYDFSLRFHQGHPEANSETPELEDALADQLNLQLKQKKGEVRMLAISHVEKPSPN